MITCKPCDYLTCTLKPGLVDCTVDDLVKKVIDVFMIDDLIDFFQQVSQNFMYENILRFGDIQIKIPYVHNYTKQGVCIEFSGQGLDYYLEYLSSHFVGVDLRFIVRRFVGLSKLGYKSQCSRWDIAFDEKHNKGDTSGQLLDLDLIKSTLKSGQFICKFRKSDPTNESGVVQSSVVVCPNLYDKELPYRFIESLDLSSGRIGKTIELGKRKSNSFVRFYDKLAEQEAHKFDVPADLESWIRFEIEYKHSNASSVLEAYAKFDNDSDFINYMRGAALNLLRFIDPGHSRKYNCSTCSWWFDFLNNVNSSKLVHCKPKYNKYVRALESKKRQQAATFTALVLCDRKNLKSLILEGIRKESKSARAIMSDYNSIRFLDPDAYDRVYKESTTPETGLDFWKRHALLSGSSDEEFLQFIDQCADLMCSEVEKILTPSAS